MVRLEHEGLRTSKTNRWRNDITSPCRPIWVSSSAGRTTPRRITYGKATTGVRTATSRPRLLERDFNSPSDTVLPLHRSANHVSLLPLEVVMMYQRSTLRHRVVPPSLRTRGFPTPLQERFLTKPKLSDIWIAAAVFLFLVIGVLLATR